MENTPCTPELPTLIQAMLEPARYPHPVLRVDLVQTHISWILLAGDFAYKVKKPLKLPFLDFSTLELRRIFCLEELRLNRRYAADEDAICRVELEKKGTQFVDLTPEERARFRDAVADVVRPYREALDPAVVKAYLGAQAG